MADRPVRFVRPLIAVAMVAASTLYAIAQAPPANGASLGGDAMANSGQAATRHPVRNEFRVIFSAVFISFSP